ncbi:MAG: FlgD immunoglobulin-like domain containing protein [Fimbriimonadaceae bacterium]
MMRQGYLRLFGALTVVGAAVASNAQGGGAGFGYNCIDINNTTPFSNPFLWQQWGNNVVMASLGVVGTVTFGGSRSTTDPDPPCFVNGVTANMRGRLGFGAGTDGSYQTNFDDSMAYSFGYPIPGADWGYATLTTDSKTLNGEPASTRALFGSGAFTTSFTGSSDRYFFAEEAKGMTTIDLRIDEIGDTARLQWTLTNTDATASHTLGLWVGLWMAMFSTNTNTNSGSGLLQDGPYPANFAINDKLGYIVVPGVIPPSVEHRYIRSQDTSGFPSYVDYCFGQENAYGLRVENGPNPDTEDAQGLNSDCTPVDEFAQGQSFFLLGDPHTGGDSTFPDHMFGPPTAAAPGGTGGDVEVRDNPGYIQKYYEQSVAAGSARTIVQYYRSTWSASNYFKPYSVVLDAPPLMAADLTQTTGLATPSGGYLIRVYVDNTRGFSTADRSIELDNVLVTISLPPGLNLASGDTATRVIPKVLPGGTPADTMAHVDYHVIPDGIANGVLPYSVTVAPTPGPTKTVSGTIVVSATPKLTLAQGPNLVGVPWNFSDSSWEAVLGLVEGTDFQAYSWDPVQNGYVLSTTTSRGVADWIVATNNIGIRSLASNPQVPSDIPTGAPLVQLQGGWNLVANPYPYPVPLAQLIGATNANSQQDYIWTELVAQGFVNGAVGYYSTTTNSYNYLQNGTDLLLPNVGYWIYVGVPEPLTLKYPAVYQEYLPGSTRVAPNPWTQTDNQWRLQIAARTAKSIDDQNYVGKVATPADVTKLQIMKPPPMPAKIAGVSVAINGTVKGKVTRMAQALSTTADRQQFTMTVTTPQAGDVTLTWPNIATIPKTVQVRLVDTATGATRIMNQTSGYTFTATAGATRTFQIQMQAHTPGRATIGNVIATRTSRAVGSPVAISYTLGVAATTSIQIVNAAGKPIYTVTSGRADSAGINSVVWNLRDNANRQVAPGIYKIVITASTPDGATARRNVSVNVVR